ncbi:hypothetical protein CAOG_08853, partial [Capsaspora owczarzaki ATCC 30864]|uniref:hypothetical protein n=1 Tax=Capsaspora owczarzaki (strain ATCC 30864) TaxID=595528 RepID=UPI00035264BC
MSRGSPDSALTRAQELIDVGKKQVAIEILSDAINNKKNAWSKTLDEIMIKLIDLCVETRKSKQIKDALYVYKQVCQHINLASLEVIVRHFLTLAVSEAEKAREKSASSAQLADIEDLEAAETPESLMLSLVSGEGTKDRTDRELLAPWLRFLWDAYRTVLDILRNNAKLEGLYAHTARHAFLFCIKYARKTEFRRTCQLLRDHLDFIQKYSHVLHAVNLTQPESHQLHLELRFDQLNTAMQLELWQEAFKAIEDIHSLIGLSKRAPKPQVKALYYQRLTQVFWKSENLLFHASAYHLLFVLSRDFRKNLPQEEGRAMANAAVLATLAIPIAKARTQAEEHLALDENVVEKSRRLASLVGLQVAPSRESLIEDLTVRGIAQFASQELRDLLQWLEFEFHPLHWSKKVEPIIARIKSDARLQQYVRPLQNIIVMRLLQQLGQVYNTLKISHLQAM